MTKKTDPFREGPLFYWRGYWRGWGSREIEARETSPPPQSVLLLDLEEYVAAERKHKGWLT